MYFIHSIGLDGMAALMGMPAEWEIVSIKVGTADIVSLKVYINVGSIPLQARKEVDVSVDTTAAGETAWKIHATGPRRVPPERNNGNPLNRFSRDVERIDYHPWQQDMIAGLRCPKCFWRYPTGIGDRSVSECESCTSE
jgi:hypothetical protein